MFPSDDSSAPVTAAPLPLLPLLTYSSLFLLRGVVPVDGAACVPE